MASRKGPNSGFYILKSLLSGNIKAAWDGIKYIIMPAIALGTGMMGLVMRVTRSSVLEIMSEDYVRTARAKGWVKAPSCGGTCCATRLFR